MHADASCTKSHAAEASNVIALQNSATGHADFWTGPKDHVCMHGGSKNHCNLPCFPTPQYAPKHSRLVPVGGVTTYMYICMCKSVYMRLGLPWMTQFLHYTKIVALKRHCHRLSDQPKAV